PLRRVDEVDHPDPPALVPDPQREPEGGRRLALTDARVHPHQRPDAPLTRRQSVARHHTRLSPRHYAALLVPFPRTSLTSPAIASARKASSVTAPPPSSPASRPARPSRTGPDSQSTTTDAIPSAANSRAARPASATG